MGKERSYIGRRGELNGAEGTAMEAVRQTDPDEESLGAESSYPGIDEPKKCCSLTPERLICISHALSAWGDRMWEFAVALYLVELTPGSLRLTAIFQLVRTLVVIFLGPFVGNWVDGNPRLRVAKVSLVVQNLAVATSALILLLILSLHLSSVLFIIAIIFVIVVACLSVLAGIATKVAIEKDWVIVIAGSDKSLLAATNAILRRIDLVCKILAPALVGQIMTYVSKAAGVILIAAWNVVSVFFEYYMLVKVFHAVPSLAVKKIDKTRHGTSTEDTQSNAEQDIVQQQGDSSGLLYCMEQGNAANDNDEDRETLVSRPRVKASRKSNSKNPGIFQRLKNKAHTLKIGTQIYMRQSVVLPGLALAAVYFTVLSFGSITTGYIYTQNISESLLSILRAVGSLFGVLATFVFPRMRNSLGLVRSGLFSMSAQFCCMLLCLGAIFAPGSPFFLLPDSWRFYGSTETIHVFHNGTEGNCSGLSPSSITFPAQFAVKMFGQQIAESPNSNNSFNISLSSLLPSSTATSLSFSSSYSSKDSHVSSISPSPSVSSSFSSRSTLASSTTLVGMTSKIAPFSPSTRISPSPSQSFSPSSSQSKTKLNCTQETIKKKKTLHNFSYISISLLITGIIVSRFGLWLSDLSISQLQQENVPEEERGIVGAMQKSFNSLLDMSMYVCVISLPKPEQFGIPGILSVAAVGIAGILYATFAYKTRGHLFHFERVRRLFARTSSGSHNAPSHRASSQDSLDHDEEEDAMIRGILSTRNENFKP